MRNLIIVLLSIFCVLSCSSHSKVVSNAQNLVGVWSFEQFEDVAKPNDSIRIIKTGYIGETKFNFKHDQILEVLYPNLAIEKYGYIIEKDIVIVTPINDQPSNPKIVGSFELHFWKDYSHIFLQRRKSPHNGIMLKK